MFSQQNTFFVTTKKKKSQAHLIGFLEKYNTVQSYQSEVLWAKKL